VLNKNWIRDTRLDAYGSVQSVIRVIWSDVGVLTSKYLRREGNYGHSSSKSTKHRVVQAVGSVSTLMSMRYVIRVQWNDLDD
jgi:hypothetical protein